MIVHTYATYCQGSQIDRLDHIRQMRRADLGFRVAGRVLLPRNPVCSNTLIVYVTLVTACVRVHGIELVVGADVCN